MNSHTEKIFGYVLLCIGLICILFAIYSVYKVFTNITNPPEIFQMKSFSFLASSDAGRPPMEFTISLDSQLRKIVNVFLYYLFMLFIVAVGSKICTLGIQFIKEIKVQMKKEG